MATYFNTIAEAAKFSRDYDSIGTVRIAANDGWEPSLAQLRDACLIDEDYDYTDNGGTLEFWAYDPTDEDKSAMTMRVHVVRE